MRHRRKQLLGWALPALLLCLSACSGLFPEPGQNELVVTDQASDGKSLRISKLVVSEKAWLVVSRAGTSTQDVVHATFQLKTGTQENVEVPLAQPIRSTTTVTVKLYVDTTKDGQLQIGQDEVAHSVSIKLTIETGPPPSYNVLEVEDQRGDGTSITIARLNLLKQGWLYVTKSSIRSPNDIFATVSLTPGQQLNYRVPLENAVTKNASVKVSVHIDDGDGEFDPKKDKIAKGQRSKQLSDTIVLNVQGAESNELVIQDQTLIEGNTDKIQVTKLALMNRPGILFLAKDNKGKVGKILGRFSYSSETIKNNFSLKLSESLTSAQTLHATLYEGPSWKPGSPLLKDKAGKPIQLTFGVTIQAATQGATLEVEDQTLTDRFNVVSIKQAALPPTYLGGGLLQLFLYENGKFETKVGEARLAAKKQYTDLTVTIDRLITGKMSFEVRMIDGKGKSFTDKGGKSVQTVFHVTGDTQNATLAVTDQQLASDLQTVKISSLFFPPRFREGGFVAIYADDQGKRGKLLQKKQFPQGKQQDVSIRMTSKLAQKQRLHAALHAGRSWSSRTPPPVITLFSGGEVKSSFEVDNDALHAVLEITDQSLADNRSLTIQKVVVPPYVFGGYLAIYDDNNGAPGQLLVKRNFPRGTRTNQLLKLPLQQGTPTLHAKLFAGQRWDPSAPLLKDRSGKDIQFSFKLAAPSLNYLTIKPYTAEHPRHVILEGAHSYKHMAWVVLARDNNGKPGTIIAKRRVAARHKGRVMFSYITRDFESSGLIKDFLQSKPGTYRRSVRGSENLHVLMYADSPKDNKFTYQPGGTEDQPLLDAKGNPVAGRWQITMKASIQNSQRNSNRFYSPCSIKQWRENPTPHRADCRCSTVLGTLKFPDCDPSIADYVKLVYGKGPRIRTLNYGVLISGFGEKATNELITVAKWKDIKTRRPESGRTIDVGVVMAIHAETGDRRIIGGRYTDTKKGAHDIGNGPALSYPFRIRKGPDGNYYIASVGYIKPDANTIGSGLVRSVDIIRMNPKTGDRAYVWRSNHLGFNFTKLPNPYGHCANGRSDKYGYASIQISSKAFAMDPQGNFYLSYANNGKSSTSEGIGIIKVSFDGKSCSFITRTDTGTANVAYKGKNIGQGPKPQAGPYRGMLYKDGDLYAGIFVGGETYKINVTTGDREVIMSKKANFGVYSGGNIIKWDASRKLVWQQGLSTATSFYDPATKKAHSLHCPVSNRNIKGINCMLGRGSFIRGIPSERGFWFHPNNKDYMFMQILGTMIKVHLPSGTDIIHSR